MSLKKYLKQRAPVLVPTHNVLTAHPEAAYCPTTQTRKSLGIFNTVKNTVAASQADLMGE